jgi:hypothetical protein
MTLRHAFLIPAVLGLALPAAQASAEIVTETFDSVAPNTSTPFSDNIFAFSSPSDPSAYYVGPTNGIYATLTGNALLPTSATPSQLDIKFALPVNALTLDFALTDILGTGGTDDLSWMTNAGGNGSASATVPSAFFYPEGQLVYSGAPIAELMLTSQYTLSIDNIVANAIPEPATLTLFGFGSLCAVALRRREAARARAIPNDPDGQDTGGKGSFSPPVQR